MLPLHTHVRHSGSVDGGIYKVVTLDEPDWPHERCLQWAAGGSRPDGDSPLAGVFFPGRAEPPKGWNGLWLSAPANPAVVSPGDVIRVRSGSTQVSVLYRRGANANSLFATERCNSQCLMCSQPPRPGDDDWRVREMLEVVNLVDKDEPQLGITGGEPTLLGDGLATVIAACADTLPTTALHILTNGRRFADRTFADSLLANRHPRITWAVPLYGDVPQVHDFVVQAHNAFNETLHGLHELARWRQSVEIRIVLHRITVPRLSKLAYFIARNLPFVSHIALMGLEPMGFAKLNRDQLWIDPADYAEELGEAVHLLANRGLRTSIYNLPLCVLPPPLRPFARQSISDWKNTYAPECAGCTVANSCAGFFTSADRSWRSKHIRPVGPGIGG